MFTAITWNPDPIIVEFYGFALRWYSLLFATGFIIGFFILRRLFEQEKVSLEVLDKMLLYSVVGTILGARIGNCLFYDFAYFSEHPLEILLPFKFSPDFEFTGYRGLASHGAMLGLLVAYWLLARKTDQTMLWFLDKAATSAALALACIRLGNFMNSEIVGAPTDVSWAFIFPRVDDLPRHPVQLYGFAVYLSLFFFMLWYNKKVFGKVKDGHVFAVFLSILGILRFGMEFIKKHYVFDPESLINMAQLLSLPMIILGALFAWYTRAKVAK
ncbi:MAG: Prolipoprotein diacylglyceryl transferase (EC [uncultured Aureispira sp.]|uniref:Phosphatidylglycerol--prolipoprotein diacylglyceryl transferase n=1 Tax=uncultured Aureispira sp. TaxID=1331704 RepID=A0A6S6TUZ1_9BACT|nr:MAG: Prolipoprotein diacylglyceryl transferase (EC [uncultured Aureispira sp.]